MNFNFKEIFTAFMVLFAVIDIVGNIPIIIDLRKKVGHIQSEKASIIAGVIMIVFLFLGKSILNLIGIDVNSFAVAGAFVIFFIAMEMILGITLYKEDEHSCHDCFYFSSGISTYCRTGKLNNVAVSSGRICLRKYYYCRVINVIVIYIVLKNLSKN